VERVRTLRDDLGLKIAEQDFLRKLEKSNSVNINNHVGNQFSIPAHRSNNLILIGQLYNITILLFYTFLIHLKVSQNGWMKRSENAFVDETEVVVATFDNCRLGLVADTLHHDGVSLQQG